MEELRRAILSEDKSVVVNGLEFTKLPKINRLDSQKKREEFAEREARKLYNNIFG